MSLPPPPGDAPDWPSAPPEDLTRVSLPESAPPSLRLIALLVFTVLFSWIAASALTIAVSGGRRRLGIGALLASVLVGQAVGFWTALSALRLLRRRYRLPALAFGIDLKVLNYRQIKEGLRIYLLSLPGVFALAGLTQFLADHYGFPTDRPEVEHLFKTAQGHPLAVGILFLLGSVGAPLFEELTFRGLLYSGLRLRWNATASILVSALFFAFMHVFMRFFSDPRVFPFAIFYLGIVLGLIRERTQSVAPGMAVHALNNLMALALGLLAKRAM